MRLFSKYVLKNKNGKSRLIKFFNIPFLIYNKSKDGKVKINFPIANKKNINSEKPIFYLKINSEYYYATICMQHWVDVAREMNAKCIIICDKESVYRNILSSVEFYDLDVTFIKSLRKALNNVIKNVTSEIWEKAGFAHLTTLFHAQKYNIQSFWNIDADDTMLLMPAKDIANYLKNIENYAKEKNISLFSLDMWRSRTRSKAWTFGITYTQNIEEQIGIIKKASSTWKKDYVNNDNGLNVDWYMTYLKNTNQLNIETFYIENSHFIHWCRRGDFLINILGAYLCTWNNGEVLFPIVRQVFNNEPLGVIPIASDCIKFDFNIPYNFGVEYALKNITNLKTMTPKLKKLWHVDI